MSHELGRIGLLARENVTLLNAALVELARSTADGFIRALGQSGISAPLYITQNDGTISLAAQAVRFPVHCFASGPTNSLRGAAFLSGIKEALVVDVGGTTSDVGCLRHGFPREANNTVEVGGVRTAFRMPDLLSIGLGGGTLIDPKNPRQIGPVSVGYRLCEQAMVFGGKQLTCTDVAVAAGLIRLGDARLVAKLDRTFVAAAIECAQAMLEEAVDRMKSDASEVPLIAVGGGSFLVPEEMAGISQVQQVPHQGVANAVGAAIAQVSGEVDQIYQGLTREQALGKARALAAERAAKSGADSQHVSPWSSRRTSRSLICRAIACEFGSESWATWQRTFKFATESKHATLSCIVADEPIKRSSSEGSVKADAGLLEQPGDGLRRGVERVTMVTFA